MDPSPEEIVALADQLSQLAKTVATAQDPKSRKSQTAALVMQAKQLIWQTQDPFDAIMDHVVNVSLLCLRGRPSLGRDSPIKPTQGYTIAACLAASKLGIFEAIPPTGTATAREVAKKCNAAEDLIGMSP